LSAIYGDTDSIRNEIPRIEESGAQGLGGQELFGRSFLHRESDRYSHVQRSLQERLQRYRR